MTFLYSTLILLSLTLAVQCQLSSDTTDFLLRQAQGEKINKTCTRGSMPSYLNVEYELLKCDIESREDIIAFSQNSSEDYVVSKYCRQNKRVLCDHIRKRLDDECLTEAQEEYLKYRILSDAITLEYICLHNGRNLRALSKVYLSDCTLKGDRKKQCSMVIVSMNDVEEKDFYNEINCRKQVAISECFASVYEFCVDQTVYNFIKNVTYYSLMATPCKMYVNELHNQDQSKCGTTNLYPSFCFFLITCIIQIKNTLL